jgi:hypothetical protein
VPRHRWQPVEVRRAPLDKARAALEVLKEQGGSTDERMKVQNRLIEIEQQIQDLAVSLGDFDSQNKLCTVKLTLSERTNPLRRDSGRVHGFQPNGRRSSSRASAVERSCWSSRIGSEQVYSL